MMLISLREPYPSCRSRFCQKASSFAQRLSKLIELNLRRTLKFLGANSVFAGTFGMKRMTLLKLLFFAGNPPLIQRIRMFKLNSIFRIEEEIMRINFVLTYHPALNRKIIEILRRNHDLLQTDDAHKRLFQEFPRVAFRRPKNIKDHLVRAKLYQLDEGSKGCSSDCIKCRSDCQIGKFLQTTPTFSSQHSDKIYNIRVGPLHCNSKMVIYLLICKTCGIRYVGKSYPRLEPALTTI